MKTKFTLPNTTAQATKMAGSLMKEATEREFSLAALVFAQVLPNGKRVDPDARSGIQRVTCKQFSDRDIRGLTSHSTVKKYRDTWQKLVDKGKVAPVRLGDTAEWDSTLKWHEWYPGDYRDGTPERHVGKEHVAVTPAKVKEAIEADPALAIAAREALAERGAKLDKERASYEAGLPKDGPMVQLNKLHMQLRGVKRTLTDALGNIIDIRGVTDTDEVRAAISGYVGQIRHILDLMDEAAKGKSLDDELAELLMDEERSDD